MSASPHCSDEAVISLARPLFIACVLFLTMLTEYLPWPDGVAYLEIASLELPNILTCFFVEQAVIKLSEQEARIRKETQTIVEEC